MRKPIKNEKKKAQIEINKLYNQIAHYYIDIEEYYLCNQKFREVANLICNKYL